MRAGRLAAVTAIVCAACGGGPSVEPTPDPTPAPSPVSVDWTRLDDLRPIDVGGFRIMDCDGDAPLVCIERDGETVGVVELLVHPADPPEDANDPLASRLEGHQRTFRADRTASCPAGWRFEPAPRRDLTVAGRRGIRGGFSVFNAAGTEVEREVVYFALDGDRMITIAATALAEGACIELSGSEFDPPVLEDALPVIDRLAAGSVIPRDAEIGGSG